MRHHTWENHPHVRTGDQLTFGERAADGMRNGLGTWTFLVVFMLVLVMWIVAAGFGFDKSPFFKLNLFLSCLAGLQGAIILIAQKRADRVASEAATQHFEETQKIDALIRENTILTTAIKGNTDLLEEIHQHVSVLSPDAGRIDP